MSGHAHERLEEALRELAADFLGQESNRTSLVTVTGATLSKDRGRATVYVTVFPDEAADSALDFARRKRPELREYVRTHLRTRMVPFIEIELDRGEKHRQHIDDLSQNF